MVRQGADQGDASAQNRLGAMFVRGQGVARDYVLAPLPRRLPLPRQPLRLDDLVRGHLSRQLITYLPGGVHFEIGVERMSEDRVKNFALMVIHLRASLRANPALTRYVRPGLGEPVTDENLLNGPRALFG